MTMSINIYLIKHLDTGTGYVGITGDELGKRWYQHLHDPKSALYKALRAEGHRMSMELLEEVATREEALIKEQQYIHALGTAHPNGWNRMIKNKTSIQKPKRYKRIYGGQIRYESKRISDDTMVCPVCYDNGQTCNGQYLHMDDEVVTLTNGIRIFFKCEQCHYSEDEDTPPKYFIEIWHRKGQTMVSLTYYVEENK
jgi:hypothetical protein